MNEKIKQFAEQAGIGFYWDSPSVYAPADEPPVEQALIIPAELEKFAQLIVQECAGACLAATEPGSPVHLVSVAYADAVRRHFGVEE